jgi:hypothetical protein
MNVVKYKISDIACEAEQSESTYVERVVGRGLIFSIGMRLIISKL